MKTRGRFSVALIVAGLLLCTSATAQQGVRPNRVASRAKAARPTARPTAPARPVRKARPAPKPRPKVQKPTAKPKPGGAKRPGPAPSPAPFVGGEPSEIEARILDLTNAERAKAGLAPLAWNNRLGAAAQAHSANMAATGIYAHEIDGQGPGDRINNTGYKSATFGENIYLEAPAIEALFFADSAVASWMDSPGHRANILNPEYTEMGIGVAFPPYIDDGRGMYDPRWRAFYATQDFAKPLR